MGRTYRTQGIVIKRTNFGEADRLLTVFTQHYGKLKLIAKGIRRLNSRKKGHLELFSQARLFIAKGKNLDIVTEAETINNFSLLRKDLPLVQTAYLFSELTDQLTAENQAQPQVYQLLTNCLNQLNHHPANIDNLIIHFEKNLLHLLGFGLPKLISRQTLEAHVVSITEKPLKSLKL